MSETYVSFSDQNAYFFVILQERQVGVSSGTKSRGEAFTQATSYHYPIRFALNLTSLWP